MCSMWGWSRARFTGKTISARRRANSAARLITRMRSARGLALFAALVTLLVPAQATAFNGMAVSMLADGPTIMCRANGDMVIVRDGGTTAPAGSVHDCCGHCIAAAAPPLHFPVWASAVIELQSRAVARMPVMQSLQITQRSIRTVFARGPPALD